MAMLHRIELNMNAVAESAFEQRFERGERALPSDGNHLIVPPPPGTFVESILRDAHARGAAALRGKGDFEGHRSYRIAVRRQPERIRHEEALRRIELHHRAAEHPAEPAEDLVAILGRCPLDRIGPERPRRRDRARDLPPRVQRRGVEEGFQHPPRRRGDDDGDVEAGWSGHGTTVVRLSYAPAARARA